MSWEEHWKTGHTPWDAERSPPALLDLVSSGTLPSGRVLVPGCGAGYDVLTLTSAERAVTGLEVAPSALPRFETLRAEAGVPAERATVHHADFFDWEPDALFDLIWDYTFLCAIEPSEREAWAHRVDALLAPGGELVTLIFPVADWPAEDHPPYRMSPDLVSSLLSRRFQATLLEPAARSHPGREGMEWLGRWRRR